MKSLIVIAMMLVFVGCDSLNQGKCLMVVKEEYVGCEVSMIAGEKYKFLVATDSSVIYVEVMGPIAKGVTYRQEVKIK